MKCEVFKCQNKVYRRLSVGPGTSTALCETHFVEFEKELISEDPKAGGKDMEELNASYRGVPRSGVQKNGVLVVQLENVDIPRAGVLADLLQEWVDWVKQYYPVIDSDYKIMDLHKRTREAVKKWSRDG